jgi:hypothetical protein
MRTMQNGDKKGSEQEKTGWIQISTGMERYAQERAGWIQKQHRDGEGCAQERVGYKTEWG